MSNKKDTFKNQDLTRYKTVGAFLKAYPEAKKVVNRYINERVRHAFHNLGNEENKQHVTRRGGIATRFGSMLGRGTGFNISCKARAV
ncbi:hypothetical protein [Burkholderia pseudomallei]|uniref:hypothetical protein n=1 Tax=Burkholderia pseudomallei TaxID=28450 RepID=UPI00053775F3|nr:hypothetical protein [Burkholderia pseudomallei]KGW52300.1 hypothetical protein Y049_518 [Burkholderia pseudomallei MSHR684]OMW24977.1 hypothetical protein AQ806_04555 [Burkholderia pseudomallei]